MEKHAESNEVTQSLSSASAKKNGRGEECTAFQCSNPCTIAKAQLVAYIFLNFPLCPEKLIAVVTW